MVDCWSFSVAYDWSFKQARLPNDSAQLFAQSSLHRERGNRYPATFPELVFALISRIRRVNRQIVLSSQNIPDLFLFKVLIAMTLSSDGRVFKR